MTDRRLLHIWITLLLFCSCKTTDDRRAEPYSFQQTHMGTDVRVLLYASDSLRAGEAAAAAFDEFARLDSILSPYRPDSELSRFNARAGVDRALPVSEPLFDILRLGKEAAGRSGGAFDITVGPIVELWQRIRRSGRGVHPDTLQKALDRVDYRRLDLNEEERTARLMQAGMSIDPGAIGKGYAADRALEVIDSLGIRSALVDAGGDMAFSQAPPGRSGWEIRLEGYEASLELENRGVASSGDLYQFVELDGVRYSHILDPSTGMGLPGRRMVTVIAADATTADVQATAIAVMGADTAKCRIPAGVEFLYIRYNRTEQEREVDMTEGFRRFAAPGPSN